MNIIDVRNVHEALPRALQFLDWTGIQRESRNGPVLMAPGPVTTVYERPQERVIFWPDRDANPFFHLYESLWMLAGRRDVAGVVRYAKRMADYSDDGRIFHGAYGYRWRQGFGSDFHSDQLEIIAKQLRKNPDDRRNILQMWSMEADLGGTGKDLPCNLMATFQRGHEGELNMVVFCRSNDIILGAYGANAVHFSMLLEYMALWIGCPIGTYTQISVNWHAYVESLSKVSAIRPDYGDFVPNPYIGEVHPIPLTGDIADLDERIETLLYHADHDFFHGRMDDADNPFIEVCYSMFRAHYVWRTHEAPQRFSIAYEILSQHVDQQNDWIVAGKEWIMRRKIKWEMKQS